MNAETLAAVVAKLLLAIQALAGYPVPSEAPTVAFVPHAVLEREACDRPCEVYGWFPPGTTIYLDDRLDPVANLQARAVLLHELVHFVQQENGAFTVESDCRKWADRERQAYEIQYRWLRRERLSTASAHRFGPPPWQLACGDDGATADGAAPHG